MEAGILHRDISVNNVMLVPPDQLHESPADGYSNLSMSGRYHISFLNDMDYAFDTSGAAVDDQLLLDKTVSLLMIFFDTANW